MLHTIFSVLQIITAIFMAFTILIQEKGGGLGEGVGGSAGAGASFQATKRGAEKLISTLTFVLAFCFLAFSLVLNFV
ncbi:MAG: preprotein translocase subunit SecG [Patescibacteria group bacterium]